MNPEDALLASLDAVVQANPNDLTLRQHLAELLHRAGRSDEAIAHCAAILQIDAGNAAARALMAAALSAPLEPTTTPDRPAQGMASGAVTGPAPGSPEQPERWAVNSPSGLWGAEQAGITLADVGGMTEVKNRIDAAFLTPLRNPEFRQLYGKSLRGGLLLWGPPGCGKTFIARALAGELDAKFISVGLSDVLSMWLGESEHNVHELFEFARAIAPVVLFLDELDALGQKRSQGNSTMRGSVNQLLQELDGVSSNNEGVFVLGATNMPWDLDPALRRPGRFDRTVLVLPPDAPAREAILKYHFRGRPTEGLDLAAVAGQTDGMSGADLGHLAEVSAEQAMMTSIQTGRVRPIVQDDLKRALTQVRPSIGAWLEMARNVVDFGPQDPIYSDLRIYLQRRRGR